MFFGLAAQNRPKAGYKTTVIRRRCHPLYIHDRAERSPLILSHASGLRSHPA